MNTKYKIIVSLLLLITVNSSILIGLFFVHLNKDINYFIDKEIESAQTIVSVIEKHNYLHYKRRIKSFIQRLTTINQGMTLKAFQQRDRQKLTKLTYPFLKTFQKENPYFSTLGFVLPDNINFLRVHNPKKYNDDVSAMRPDVVEANQDHQPKAGYRVVRTGLVYSQIYPIVFNDEYLGLAQFGIKEEQLLDAIKKELDIPVALIIPTDKSKFIVRSRMPAFSRSSFMLRAPELDFFKQADAQSNWNLDRQRITMQGKTYVIVKMFTLHSYNGEAQAQIIAGLDISPQLATLRSHFILIVSISCLVLLLSFFILHRGYDTLSRQLMQKNTELDEKREFLAVTLRSIGDGIITTDLDGKILLINKVTEKLTGWTQQEACGKAVEEVFMLINEQTGKQCASPVKKILDTGQVIILENHTLLVAKNNNTYCIEDSGAPIFDRNSKIIGTILVFRDVTARKQTEKQLRKIIDIVPAKIFVKNIEGRFLLLNKAVADGYQMQITDIIDRLHADIHPDRDEIKQMLSDDRRTIENNTIVNIPQESFQDAAGNTCWFQTIKVPCPDDIFGEPAVLGIATDITEQVRIEQELLKVKKLESIGVLAGGIAHDFNNILAAILGNVDLALYNNPDSKTCSLLENAKKALMRAKGLTQQLLTFSKGGDPIKETTSFAAIITDSANFVLHGSAVVCDYRIAEDLYPVNVDTGQISQVIQNIIINANHAMPDGGLIEICCSNIPEISTEQLSLPLGRYIKLTIADSGTGISQRYLDKIFDPYFSTKQTGSGLGLAICHSIISKHNGNISVESDEDKGTVFTIYLPGVEDPADTDTPQTMEEENTDKAIVMVMDDEQMVRDMVGKMLTRSGHEAILVKNGHEAIETYNEYYTIGPGIDVIIMDLTIPGGMGGKDTAPEILRIDPEANIIVASGYSNDPAMVQYQDYGFKAAISKPFQLSDLNAVINEVLS